jgi:membrane protease YdiL (CAAX protease family)
MGVSSREMGSGSLVAFFALAFALTWGVCAAMILFRADVEAVAGPISGYNPVFILAVWGPAIAAFILITLRYGLRGLGAFLRRLTLWRMHWGWWAFLIFSIPAARYFGAALNGTLSDPFPFSPWYNAIPILLLTLIIGPVEEFGWRGFALPLLQRKMAPFWATLILGFIWAIWHYPAFIIRGTPQEGGDFPTFVVAAMVISVLFTALFNASRGSILMPVLYHFSVNNPALPDGGSGWVIAILVFVAIIVWLTREKMFRRDGGETELLLART